MVELPLVGWYTHATGVEDNDEWIVPIEWEQTRAVAM